LINGKNQGYCNVISEEKAIRFYFAVAIPRHFPSVNTTQRNEKCNFFTKKICNSSNSEYAKLKFYIGNYALLTIFNGKETKYLRTNKTPVVTSQTHHTPTNEKSILTHNWP
jgi:hypothetical protein